MDTPHMAAADLRAHATFTALMWALSYPGRPQVLPATGAHAFHGIAEALVDLETSYYTTTPELGVVLAKTGGRSRAVAEAMYQFYPTLTSAASAALSAAPVGSYAYPDEAATLVIGCRLGTGQQLRLRGPGIAAANSLHVAGIPADFWPLRAQACRFPLGWDVFLVDGEDVVGLPRTTQIEVA